MLRCVCLSRGLVLLVFLVGCEAESTRRPQDAGGFDASSMDATRDEDVGIDEDSGADDASMGMDAASDARANDDDAGSDAGFACDYASLLGRPTRLAPEPTDRGFLTFENEYRDREMGFGAGVALQGDRIAITAPGAYDANFDSHGGFYAFERKGVGWERTAFAFTGTSWDDLNGLDHAIGVAATTIAIGFPTWSDEEDYEGYVAFWSTSGVSEQWLTPQPIVPGYFGSTLSLENGTIVVGAPIHGAVANGSTAGLGAVYVSVYDGGQWQAPQRLLATMGDDGDQFGAAVALSGTRFAVGAPKEDSALVGGVVDPSNNDAHDSGAVYIFELVGNAWTQTAFLKGASTDADAHFGAKVTLLDDILVACAPDMDHEDVPESGTCEVFEYASGTWSRVATLERDDAGANDHFGVGVAIGPDTIAIGAPGANAGAGTVSIYRRVVDQWSVQLELSGTAECAARSFGRSVAISGSTIAIGAPGRSPTSGRLAGEVLVYTLP